jgi:ADP-ribose pyrophosphatase YjhB (NUDIX family)
MRQTGYRYCPLCATALEERSVYHQQRLVCPACGFVHFPDPKVVVIGLVVHRAKVLLVRRASEPAKGLWSLPGGYMDAGEMPAEALQRELHEEVGLPIQIVRFMDFFPIASTHGRNAGIVLAFYAQPADEPGVLQCAEEVSAADWFASHELPTDLAFESTHTLLARWQSELVGYRPAIV